MAKKTHKKAKRSRKPKTDASQIALSMVEKAIGGKLAAPKAANRRS